MSDEISAIHYGQIPQPALRVCASYPASDGQVPEEVSIEFGAAYGQIDPETVARAVESLAHVATMRYAPGSAYPGPNRPHIAWAPARRVGVTS